MNDQELERVRAIPVQTLLGLSTGRRKMVRCPIHNDRTPSLCIYPNGGFYCFGCAVYGKGALDFLVKSGIPFKDALKHLTSGGVP